MRKTKFSTKIICLFITVFLSAMIVSGGVYYSYLREQLVEDFQNNAKDVLDQTNTTLSIRLNAAFERVESVLINRNFSKPICEYLNEPGDKHISKVLTDTADFLRDINSGESLIDTTFIYTDKIEMDGYVKNRRQNFDFKESVLYKPFTENSGLWSCWFPAMEDIVFKSNETVIPYVRKIRYSDAPEDIWMIVLFSEKELQNLVNMKHMDYDAYCIVDKNGECILGEKLYGSLTKEKWLMYNRQVQENAEIVDMGKEYSDYIVASVYNEIPEWYLYSVKSRSALLKNLNRALKVIIVFLIFAFLISALFITMGVKKVTEGVRILSSSMEKFGKNDFKSRAHCSSGDEIGKLCDKFNDMADEIQNLLEQKENYIEELKMEKELSGKLQEQKRKAELQALQAQINPHFLYNVLNMITLEAEDVGAGDISRLSASLGRFFRLSLSKGAEFIKLESEIEHVENYLKIQSLRYKEKMSYSIELDQALKSVPVIKLILQPLVENSIYHGIKPSMRNGYIKVVVHKKENTINIQVIDNGVGISAQKLEMINEELDNGRIMESNGYGIYNVNERIKLAYGKQYGLHYVSEPNILTKAILQIPLEMEKL